MADSPMRRNFIPGSGILHTDNAPINQPKGTLRYALNAVNETEQGKQGSVTTEGATIDTSIFTEGFMPIGDRYMQEDNTAVILVNPSTSKEEIGIVDRDGKYVMHVNTGVLGMRITNQADIIYRMRRGKERVIYWVDGHNRARTFNYDRPHNFYTEQYKFYLKSGGNPDLYSGDKWDASSFDLIKTYENIPHFSNIEIIETGNMFPGSYNLAIQFVDEDLNPTAWITTSNTITIFNDTITNTYDKIRGSKNVNNTAQSFPKANKSIKATITNLDTSFPYYRVGIIQANSVTGQPSNRVVISDLQSTTDSIFIYSGNDENLTTVELGEVLIDNEIIYAPNHIEQLENRLVIANTQGKRINFCEFQKYASKIASDLVTKEVILNNVISEPNIKNAKSSFFFGGFMPGEVHAFNIHYVFTDNYISPGFHVPGKSLFNTTSLLKVYEGQSKYLDIHNCSTDNFWGVDSEGNQLLGQSIRFHRLPFRHEVNKPLYTRSGAANNVTKYRLKVTFTLNPSWTPGPISYPVGVDSTPLIIPYRLKYRVGTSPTDTIYSASLSITDIGKQITIYDDITALSDIIPSNKVIIDDTSLLYTQYQTPGNERFIISAQYENYIIDTTVNTDTSEIFGINFSNIEKPHPDVIGFIITRAKQHDDDRMILDTAVFGPMTEYQNYKSFGYFTPKQFYQANNCGITHNAGKTLQFYDNGVWFFNPQFQFNNKKDEFGSIVIEGSYVQTSVQMPTISNTDGQPCNNVSASGNSKGVYINDVQAGTSFNPEINKSKNKDDDGFDLLIGYKNTNMQFSLNTTNIGLPVKKRVIYLNAASYQVVDSDILYNVSVDNKIGIYATNDPVDITKLRDSGTNANSLLYGALVRDSNSLYSNFLTRPYFKAHNNPIMFGSNSVINNVEIFNGNANISAINMISSVFYDMVVADRPKKNNVWKIVLGAVLVVAGVVVGIFTGGAGLTLSAVGAGVLSALAISYGVSLAISGIKFEQFKKMVDVDYEKGLKETVVDGAVFETIRDVIDRGDDTIRWFSDRVSNIYIESAVPVGLRSGLTAGVPDFIDAPAEYDEAGFRSYLTEKFTVVDRDQGSGRLYKGYPTAEFYDVNPDYSRFNEQKVFISLPIEYDCCSDDNELFPMRVWYSQQSFQEEKVDNYRIVLPNNYRDIEGEHGEITDMYRMGNSLFIHTHESLFHLPQNIQERITNEIVSFIGTGEFFNIPPRKVIDGTLGYGGSGHKWATEKTRSGVVFVSESENKVYLHAEGLLDISSKGMRNWFENNLRPFLNNQIFHLTGRDFLHKNNPANPDGIGYLSNYDTRFDRVLITKRDYLILPNRLSDIKIVDQILSGAIGFSYNTSDGKFYEGNQQVRLDNENYFENRSWTISYSFHTNGWVSFHSYLPNFYIHGHNNMFSYMAGSNNIWRHNNHEKFLSVYGNPSPFILEVIKTDNPTEDTILEDISFHTDAKRWDATSGVYSPVNLITFNKIIVYNTKQCTGEKIMAVKEMQASPLWYNNQTLNQDNVILIDRVNNMWNVNQLRDAVITTDEPIFVKDWVILRGQFPIDKVLNPSVLSSSKVWWEQSLLHDKYAVIRLKFDNFDTVQLTFNFILNTEQPSLP